MFVYTVEDLVGYTAALVFIIVLAVILAGYGLIRLISWIFGGMMYRLWRYDPDAKEEENNERDYH